MKKMRFSIILLAAFISFQAWGQTRLTEAQQKQIVEKIDRSAQRMTTMQCTFTQTKSMKMLSKKMISKGVMYFKRPSQLRWQYTSPYDYTFLLNGDKIRLKSAKSTKDISVQGNKMFRQITNIILNSITGGSLRSTSDFWLEMYKTGNTYFARLYPKKKELKQVYQIIEIYFSPALDCVSSVKMIEKSGDTTLVELNGIKYNASINEKMFSLR